MGLASEPLLAGKALPDLVRRQICCEPRCRDSELETGPNSWAFGQRVVTFAAKTEAPLGADRARAMKLPSISVLSLLHL
jgi:hypothetical protein